MQTTFGCCLVDGKVVDKKSEKLKVKSEKLKTKKKKVIHQSKVEFE